MHRLLVLPAAFLLVAGCDSSGVREKPAEYAAYEAAIDATLRALDIVVGDAEASSAAACRVLVLSEDPCGNPRGFLVYSAESDTTAIQRLAAEYRRLNGEYDALLGTVRACRVVEPPEVVYEDGRCTTEPVAVE